MTLWKSFLRSGSNRAENTFWNTPISIQLIAVICMIIIGAEKRIYVGKRDMWKIEIYGLKKCIQNF